MRIADYTIAERVREGNHGTYYRATPPPRLGIDDTAVVLKVLEHHATDDDFKRFTNELRLLYSIRSDHLVELLDAGAVDGHLFMAMRRYEGALASDDDSARPDLSPDQRLTLIADAARGAHDLHEIGVAHRDIRPANVFIDGTRGRLGDLGLAQMGPGISATVGSGPIGSLVFIDPQLIASGTAGRATDIWSIGVTIHIALCGVAPFGDLPNESVLAVLRHLARTPPVVSDAIDAKVADIVRRCLAPLDRRYPTALAVAADLDALVSSKGTTS